MTEVDPADMLLSHELQALLLLLLALYGGWATSQLAVQLLFAPESQGFCRASKAVSVAVTSHCPLQPKLHMVICICQDSMVSHACLN